MLSSGYYDAYYKKALAAQRLMRSNFRAAFEKYDMLVTPTMPVETFKLGERVDDPRMMYMVDLCTVSINIAGVPAVSVPCGRDGNGMPGRDAAYRQPLVRQDACERRVCLRAAYRI